MFQKKIGETKFPVKILRAKIVFWSKRYTGPEISGKMARGKEKPDPGPILQKMILVFKDFVSIRKGSGKRVELYHALSTQVFHPNSVSVSSQLYFR